MVTRWRMRLCCAAAVSLIGGAARPALADGVFPTDAEINAFLFEAALVLVAAIAALVLLVKAVSRAGKAARERREWTPERELPVARAIEGKDLDPPS